MPKKLSIGLLIALVGFPQISETIYTPALPNVAIGLMTSAELVELTLAIYFIGFAAGVLMWGTFSDWSGRRKAMLAGLLAYGLATLGCASASSITALLLWRFFQALGASAGSVVTQTILRDAYEGAERTKLFSVMSGALAFSPAIGPLLGGFISEYLGWRANFWLLALLAVILVIWSFLALPETRPEKIIKVKMSRLILSMISNRALWGHILLIGAANGVLFGFYQEAPFVFIQQLGVKPSTYGMFGLLIAAATLLAARFSYQKASAEFLIPLGAICVLAGALVFSLPVMMGILEFKVLGIALALLTLFLIFFGIGLIIPNSLSQSLKPYQASAGTAGSIFGGCYYCFIAGCTWFMSVLHNGTALPLPLYMSLLGVLLVCGSIMIRVAKAPQLETVLDGKKR